MAGLTLTDILGAEPLNGIPPVRVPEIVPAPVTASDKFALPPLHMDGVPLNTAVGRGLTVTVADPVLSEAMELQVPFVKVTIE